MNGVIYYVSTETYLEPLLVSLWPLRRYYSGPVTVYATEDVYHSIVAEGIKQVDVILVPDAPVIPDPQNRRTPIGQCINKCFANTLSPYDYTLFLDCDTLIEADVSSLFGHKLMFTKKYIDNNHSKLNDATIDSRRTRTQIKRIRNNSYMLTPLVNRAFAYDPYLINVGVYSFEKGHPFIREWLYLSMLCSAWVVWEEMVANVLMVDWVKDIVLFGDEWNSIRFATNKWSSPKKIRHFVRHSWSQSATWRRARREMKNDASFCNHNII